MTHTSLPLHQILARVAAQVEPIMARRAHLDWRCKELREFFPDNENLLGMNVNRGAKSEAKGRYRADA